MSLALRADRVVEAGSDLLLQSGSTTLVKLSNELDRVRRESVIWVVVVVALAVIAVVGILAWAMAYCISHGKSFDGGLTVIKKSWWDIKIGFKCS